MKNNHSITGRGKQDDEGYRRHSNTSLRRSNFYLKEENKSKVCDAMQSAYLCALEVTINFLASLENCDHTTIYAETLISKIYYHRLRVQFDNFYKERRRNGLFITTDTIKCRRKSLNLNLNRQNNTLNYKTNKNTKDSGVMKRLKKINENEVMQYDGGMCSDDTESRRDKKRKSLSENNASTSGCLFKDKFVSQEEVSILNTPDSFIESSRVCSDFDILKFIVKSRLTSFEDFELPLTRESILRDFRKRFVDIPGKFDDDQIEFTLFENEHNFKDYKDSSLRDLLQLTYASLSGMLKEFVKLKLLKSPEKISEINKLLLTTTKKKEEFDLMAYIDRYKKAVFDLYYFLSKSNLLKEEIEIFNKIIYWLTGLKNEISQEEMHMILNRVKIDLFFYGRQYMIIVEFIESII